ncbi:hypothetical protein DFQ28_009670 [Apophysomyces sp. BC1034]|nr:hypothetical protein DFQ30_009919 [Apophysomyces sp. BC1015]KAG0192265.1 hypothetical protein DFQ28_009670 [Apophysomyces sp. BC1034]
MGVSMASLLFVNFLVLLVCLILALVVTLRGIRLLGDADPSWLGHAGNSMWLTIGAVVSLFLAFLFYTLGACCYKPRARKQVDPEYKGGPESVASPYVAPAHPFYHQQQQRLFQQPFHHPATMGQQPQQQQYTPMMQHQQLPNDGRETQPQAREESYQTPSAVGHGDQPKETNKQQTV